MGELQHTCTLLFIVPSIWGTCDPLCLFRCFINFDRVSQCLLLIPVPHSMVSICLSQFYLVAASKMCYFPYSTLSTNAFVFIVCFLSFPFSLFPVLHCTSWRRACCFRFRRNKGLVRSCRLFVTSATESRRISISQQIVYKQFDRNNIEIDYCIESLFSIVRGQDEAGLA